MATGAAKIKPRASMPATLVTPSLPSASAWTVVANAAPSASSGVMSLNKMPDYPKPGTSLILDRNSASTSAAPPGGTREPGSPATAPSPGTGCLPPLLLAARPPLRCPCPSHRLLAPHWPARRAARLSSCRRLRRTDRLVSSRFLDCAVAGRYFVCVGASVERVLVLVDIDQA